MYDIKKCRKCKYYQPHYVLMGTMFSPIDGHCMCKELISKRRGRDLYYLESNCAYWEDNGEARKERKKKISKAISEIEEHLKHIENMIENDIEYDK